MKRSIKYTLLAAASVVFAGSATAIAQSDGLFNSDKPALHSEEGKMVELYGQKLDPASVQIEGSDYTWKDLERYVPKLLPMDEGGEKTPEELCGYLKDLSIRYMGIHDGWIENLAEDFKEVFPDEKELDLVIAQRLKVREGVDELVTAGGPELSGKVMMAYEANLHYVTLLTLSDAAQKNCPEPNPVPSLDTPAAPVGGAKP